MSHCDGRGRTRIGLGCRGHRQVACDSQARRRSAADGPRGRPGDPTQSSSEPSIGTDSVDGSMIGTGRSTGRPPGPPAGPGRLPRSESRSKSEGPLTRTRTEPEPGDLPAEWGQAPTVCRAGYCHGPSLSSLRLGACEPPESLSHRDWPLQLEPQVERTQ
jgi:hypothetical protein